MRRKIQNTIAASRDAVETNADKPGCTGLSHFDGVSGVGNGMFDWCCGVRSTSEVVSLAGDVEHHNATIVGTTDGCELSVFNVSDQSVCGGFESSLCLTGAGQGNHSNDGDDHCDKNQFQQGKRWSMARGRSQRVWKGQAFHVSNHINFIGWVSGDIESKLSPSMHRRCRGITLVESLLAVLILSLAVMGLSYATTAGHQHLQHGDMMLRGTRLAEHLMEEIQSKPYAGTGASRMLYCIDDYHGFTEAAGNLKNVLGELYDEADQIFSRSVTVANGTTTIADFENAVIPGKTVVVTVSDGNGASWSLTRFISEVTTP